MVASGRQPLPVARPAPRRLRTAVPGSPALTVTHGDDPDQKKAVAPAPNSSRPFAIGLFEDEETDAGWRWPRGTGPVGAAWGSSAHPAKQ